MMYWLNTGPHSLLEFKRIYSTRYGELHFISNYKNVNAAPLNKGIGEIDEYGLRIYQSAPGYGQANNEFDFRYLPDGILLRILGETGNFYRVSVLAYEGEYFVRKGYIDPNNTLSRLTHVVVVDWNQQN